jgi:hypothetical protein
MAHTVQAAVTATYLLFAVVVLGAIVIVTILPQ